jgi:hypothetical protein
MRTAVRYIAAVAMLTISFAQKATQDPDKSGHDPSGQTMQGMQGMNMGEVALSSMPSFPASSGMAWQPGLGPRDDVDDFTRRLGADVS